MTGINNVSITTHISDTVCRETCCTTDTLSAVCFGVYHRVPVSVLLCKKGFEMFNNWCYQCMSRDMWQDRSHVAAASLCRGKVHKWQMLRSDCVYRPLSTEVQIRFEQAAHEKRQRPNCGAHKASLCRRFTSDLYLLQSYNREKCNISLYLALTMFLHWGSWYCMNSSPFPWKCCFEWLIETLCCLYVHLIYFDIKWSLSLLTGLFSWSSPVHSDTSVWLSGCQTEAFTSGLNEKQ